MASTIARQIRHGDVFLKEVDIQPPADAKVSDKAVLAEGEVTGHHHVLTAPKVEEWVLDLHRYVRVETEAKLDHPEHGLITVPANLPGKAWESSIQRVYSPEAIRNVADLNDR
jgi:hypothetical protein